MVFVVVHGITPARCTLYYIHTVLTYHLPTLFTIISSDENVRGDKTVEKSSCPKKMSCWWPSTYDIDMQHCEGENIDYNTYDADAQDMTK
ncbi:hypothetical protein GEMRC1_013860 [Eukaryota sp. GEM-RC1]